MHASTSGLPAGHCAFSASAAKVLQDFFGSDEVTRMTSCIRRYSHDPSLAFLLGNQQGNNNARVWGGIHTRHACTDGAELGRQVAEYCLANYMKPVN